MSRAYYNEIDPYAAQWLRNLSDAGLIAPGDVDERDIRDIIPSDLAGYTQCHFFAGIGVWSFALRMAGWPDDRPVWTGSCPCQPFSAAGRGGGVADERHLWPHWHHLIAECGPPNVFGEQVASKDGLGWLDLVQSDLEGTDYACWPVDLCAAGVGAPHIRQRLFFLAEALGNADRARGASRVSEQAKWEKRHSEVDDNGSDRLLRSHQGRSGVVRLADSLRDGTEPVPGNGDRTEAQAFGVDGGASGSSSPLGVHGSTCRLADSDGGQLGEAGAIQSCGEHGQQQADGRFVGRPGGSERDGEIQSFQLADDDDDERWRTGQTSHGRVPSWVEPQRLRDVDIQSRRPGPVNSGWANADWLFCRDGKWRPVESGTFPLAHGAPERMGRLRAYGNAIVSEAAAHVIAAYLEHEADEAAAIHAAGSRESLSLPNKTVQGRAEEPSGAQVNLGDLL